MRIYFTTDENSHLTGWSSTPSNVDNEICIDVDDNHEALSNPFIFKYENGQLVKDEQKQQELINEMNKPSEKERIEELENLVNLILLGVM